MSPGIVTWLGELRKHDVATAGGKGANLGELTHGEFPVPPGFVVTVAGYLQAMEEGSVRADLEAVFTNACSRADDPVALADASGRLQALVRKSGVPDAVAEQVLTAYHELGVEVPVARALVSHG